MSTYTQILYHIVFSTKDRQRTLDLSKKEEILGYLWGVLKNHDSYAYQMNLMEDHVHILCSIHPHRNLSDMVKLLKASTGNWIRSERICPAFTKWQNGYGAFTVSWNEKDTITQYIKNQQKHHQIVDLIAEFKLMLNESGVEFDDKYL
jgi:REP element-mobilizing transposase RayT